MQEWLERLVARFGSAAWIVPLVLSAALFLAGAASFAAGGGAPGMAEFGVLGAGAAVAMIAAFL